MMTSAVSDRLPCEGAHPAGMGYSKLPDSRCYQYIQKPSRAAFEWKKSACSSLQRIGELSTFWALLLALIPCWLVNEGLGNSKFRDNPSKVGL